ncbi:hypothetical protein [Streptomyces sp. NPDC002602]|uniref:hypothetical protein n=1 Tax=Streptomyces sp. NPDC002602 TaxID=3364654 RepID=UPI0036C4763A
MDERTVMLNMLAQDLRPIEQYTVLHEPVAGWLDAEPGEFHPHIGSLHVYEEHVERPRSRPRSRRARPCPICGRRGTASPAY